VNLRHFYIRANLADIQREYRLFQANNIGTDIARYFVNSFQFGWNSFQYSFSAKNLSVVGRRLRERPYISNTPLNQQLTTISSNNQQPITNNY